MRMVPLLVRNVPLCRRVEMHPRCVVKAGAARRKVGSVDTENGILVYHP